MYFYILWWLYHDIEQDFWDILYVNEGGVSSKTDCISGGIYIYLQRLYINMG